MSLVKVPKGWVFVDAVKDTGGTVVHNYRDKDGLRREMEYSNVWCGVSWPTETSPAYFLMMFEEYRKGIENTSVGYHGKMVFATEFARQGAHLREFFDKLTEYTVLYHCDTIYADLEGNKMFRDSYNNYINYNKIPIGYLAQAPYSNNFQIGLSFMEEWISDSLLTFPRTSEIGKAVLVFEEKNINRSSGDDEYAINALRYILGACKKHGKITSKSGMNAAMEKYRRYKR